MILQSTPVLYVEDIAPSAEFFARLGFEQTVAVPETGKAHFVILTLGGHDRADNGINIMLQTVQSGVDDMNDADPALFRANKTFLFMSVADLEAASRAVGDATLFLPKRNTFYGATEIGFTEPGGHHVVLAQMAATSPDEA